MTRRGWVVDAGIALAVFGLSLAMLRGGGFGDATPGTRALDALGVLLAAGTALPLAARRAAPLTGYAAACLASLALYALDYPLDVPFGPIVAVYSVAFAYGGDPRPARRAAALVAANLFVPAIAAAYAGRGVNVAGILPELLFWALLFAGVWLAGDRARLRREQVAELEQRARRSEREAERERRLAVAEERTRIARELHDSAGHAINVILVQAGAARLLQDRDPQRSRQAIGTIEEVARETIGEIDRLVRALREDDGGTPPVPTDPGALEELLDRHRAGGLSIGSRLSGARRGLPPSVSWAAYRILQEALTNAARHGTGKAEVAVVYQPHAVEITVTNPTAGNGTTPAATANGTHGVVGMRERASLLGGRLETAAEHGTFRLHAWLPHGGRPDEAGS